MGPFEVVGPCWEVIGVGTCPSRHIVTLYSQTTVGTRHEPFSRRSQFDRRPRLRSLTAWSLPKHCCTPHGNVPGMTVFCPDPGTKVLVLVANMNCEGDVFMMPLNEIVGGMNPFLHGTFAYDVPHQLCFAPVKVHFQATSAGCLGESLHNCLNYGQELLVAFGMHEDCTIVNKRDVNVAFRRHWAHGTKVLDWAGLSKPRDIDHFCHGIVKVTQHQNHAQIKQYISHWITRPCASGGLAQLRSAWDGEVSVMHEVVQI